MFTAATLMLVICNLYQSVRAQIKSNVDPFFSLFDVPSHASRLDRKRIMRDRETIGYQEPIDLFVFSIFLPYFLIPFNFFPFFSPSFWSFFPFLFLLKLLIKIAGDHPVSKLIVCYWTGET